MNLSLVLVDLFPQYNTAKSDLEKKINDADKKISDTKVTNIKGNIPSITGFATTAALNIIENIIRNERDKKRQIMTQKNLHRFTNEIPDKKLKEK